MVGKSSIGKTFFYYRINLNYTKFQQLNLRHGTMIGLIYYKKVIKLKNNIFRIDIWDSCEQEIFRKLIKNFEINTNIFLILYDALDWNSFEIAKSYFEEARIQCKTINPI